MPRSKSECLKFAMLKKLESDIFHDYRLMSEYALSTYEDFLSDDMFNYLSNVLSDDSFPNIKTQTHANRLYLTCTFKVIELMAVDLHINVLDHLENNCDLLYFNVLDTYPSLKPIIPFHYPHIWIFKGSKLHFHSILSPRLYGELLIAFQKENIVDRNKNRFDWITSQIPRKKRSNP